MAGLEIQAVARNVRMSPQKVRLVLETIRGKPVPEAVMTTATLGGVLLLISLMVFVIYLDVVRWFF